MTPNSFHLSTCSFKNFHNIIGNSNYQAARSSITCLFLSLAGILSHMKNSHFFVFLFFWFFLKSTKHNRIHLKDLMFSISTPQKMIVLNANSRCEIVISSPFLPSILNSFILPPTTTLPIILLSTCIIKRHKRSKNESSLKPLEPR